MLKNIQLMFRSKNRLNLILILGLAILLGLFTSGCGNTEVVETTEDSNSLTISVVSKDMYLDTAVKKFEELHPGLKVNIEEYTSNPLPTSSENNTMVSMKVTPVDIEKYVTAVNTQLMSGQGSDILLLDNLPYETYADKGLLADIGQMMQEDQSFDSSKYYQNVLEAVKYKGNLYGLPTSFSINMLVADKKLLENSQAEIDDNTWNWDDFVQVAEKIIQDNPNGEELYAMAGMDEKGLITSLVEENYSKLVDEENKTADFTGQKFLDLLNLSKYLIDNKLVNTDTSNAIVTDLASRGSLIFNVTPLRGLMGMLMINSTFGGEVELLKPPGNEGKLSFATNAMYGINNHSPNKELAWEFLKFLVSDEMMGQSTLMGMPLNKIVFPQLAQKAMEMSQKGGGRIAMKGLKDSNTGSSQAQPIQIQLLTQEDIDYLENLLPQANVYNGTNQNIIAIVQEETATFFTGQKTAELTAQLIQDRVNTYLNE